MGIPPPRTPGTGDTHRAASAEAASTSQDRIAVIPGVGPVPPMLVRAWPSATTTTSRRLFRHAADGVVRLAASRAFRHRSLSGSSATLPTSTQPGEPGDSNSGFGADRDPARLVFFSDAVFAIAVTLLVLDIRPPQDTRHLLHGLAALWPSYMAYAMTFLLIGQVWANHHVMFDHIRVADRMMLFLNTVLLMDIAFLPFAASVLSAAFRAGHGQRTGVVFYGIALELAAILFNAVWDYAGRRQWLLGITINSSGARAIRRRFRLALSWIAIGTLLGALLPIIGVGVIAAFIPFYWRPIPGEISSAPGEESRHAHGYQHSGDRGVPNVSGELEGGC